MTPKDVQNVINLALRAPLKDMQEALAGKASIDALIEHCNALFAPPPPLAGGTGAADDNHKAG